MSMTRKPIKVLAMMVLKFNICNDYKQELLERLPFEWNFRKFGENSNGTVHPGGMFSEKR